MGGEALAQVAQSGWTGGCPNLVTFKDGALSTWQSCRCPYSLQRCWTRWPLRVPSNSNDFDLFTYPFLTKIQTQTQLSTDSLLLEKKSTEQPIITLFFYALDLSMKHRPVISSIYTAEWWPVIFLFPFQYSSALVNFTDQGTDYLILPLNLAQ